METVNRDRVLMLVDALRELHDFADPMVSQRYAERSRAAFKQAANVLSICETNGKPAFATPLKWHGGKAYLARRIIDLFPPHSHYVEPFAGGLQVLFAKTFDEANGVSEVVNDLDGQLTNFWHVLANEKLFARFVRIVNAVPFSAVEFGATVDSESWPDSMINDAVSFFIRYRQSRQGLGRDFATLSRNRTRRGMNEQVSAWLGAVDALPDVHERLARVVVLNADAADVIRQQDGAKTLFYCDPPYLHETRSHTDAYSFEMDVADHIRLLDTLAAIDGRFILSGYPSQLYDACANDNEWFRTDVEIDNKASSAKTKAKKIESLWTNYDPNEATECPEQP